MSQQKKEQMSSPRPVRRRTRLKYVGISVLLLSPTVYMSNVPVPDTQNMFSLARESIRDFLNDETFPSPNDPNTRCSLVKRKPWYQRGLCWED